MLWIALYLPDLPLQLLQRAQQTTALTVLSVPSGPSIAAPPRNEAALTQALHNLCCWACQFTPTVVLQEQEGLLLEVGSTLQLHRGLSRLLVRIGKGLTELGYRAEPGIAPTPLAAWLLAKARCAGLRTRMCKDSTLLPERLAPLPMALLDWPADVLAGAGSGLAVALLAQRWEASQAWQPYLQRRPAQWGLLLTEIVLAGYLLTATTATAAERMAFDLIATIGIAGAMSRLSFIRRQPWA